MNHHLSEANRKQRQMMNESLATIEQADNYLSFKFDADDWEQFDDSTKNKALITSTRQINLLTFKGKKTDPEQELAFPRGGDTNIPKNIVAATIENALILARDFDPDIEYENIAMKEQRYGAVQSMYDSDNPPIYIQAGISSIAAWRLLLPYLHNYKEIRLR